MNKDWSLAMEFVLKVSRDGSQAERGSTVSSCPAGMFKIKGWRD